MAIYDPSITDNITPSFPFNRYKEDIKTKQEIIYEDNTSSKILSYELGTRVIKSELEPNTFDINYDEIRLSLESTIREISAMTASMEPIIRAFSAMATSIEPTISVVSAMTASMEPIIRAFSSMATSIEPTISAVSAMTASMEPIIRAFSSMATSIEPILSRREEIKNIIYESIHEPIDFHIKSNNQDDLTIDSIEDTKALLDELKDVKVDKELSKYFTRRLNE